MKKIWIFLLICGFHFSLIGQAISSYTIILNNDSSPLNASLENSNLVYSFKKSDVLTITFTELESGISKKSVEILSGSDDSVLMIGTFSRADLKADKSYDLIVSFDKLPLKSGTDEVYTMRIKDEKEQQNILRFRLI